MRRCPACGKANPDESAFCSECGHPLSRNVKICPGCHKEISLEEKFCHYCGARQPLEEPEEEKARPEKPVRSTRMEQERSQEGPNLLPVGSRRAKPVYEDLDDDDSFEDTFEEERRAAAPRKRPAGNVRPDKEDDEYASRSSSRRPAYRDYDDYDDEDEYEGMSVGLKIAIAIVGILAILAIGAVAWLIFGRGIGRVQPTTAANTQEAAQPTTAPTSAVPTTTAPQPTEPAPAQTYGELQAISASVSASSTLDQAYYNPSYLMDFNADTAWAEGEDGFGQGASITYRFNTSSWVYGIAILPGFQRSQEVYEQYAAPSKLTVDTGKVKIPISLANYKANFRNPTTSCAYFKFSVPVRADQVTVTIDDVRAGSTYQDTCITEMYFFYYPADSAKATTVKPTISSAGWENVTPTQAPGNAGGQQPGESTTAPTQAAGDGEYVLPNSSNSYVSAADLAGLTKAQLRLARNEIYARHGYRFNGEELKSYFESKSWYHPTIDPSDFDDSVLNEYEVANINAIVEAENQ